MPTEETPLQVGPIRIDPARYDVTVDGRRVELTLMQFNILRALARRPGWVHSPEQIADRLPEPRTALTPASLKNHVYQLRRRLGPAGAQVRTVRGLGYALHEADRDAALQR